MVSNNGVLVFVGGDPDAQMVPRWWQAGDSDRLVVAADSGLETARRFGARIDAVVGDMDSVDPRALAEAEAAGATVLRSPRDKDETDLELAIDWALRHQPPSLVAIGGAGGRLDHLLGNVAALSSSRLGDTTVDAWMGAAYVGIVNSSRALDLTVAPGALVTLLAQHGDAIGVRTEGLRWPLDGEDLPAGSCRGVSNEAALAGVHVEVRAGCLAVLLADATDLIVPPNRELVP